MLSRPRPDRPRRLSTDWVPCCVQGHGLARHQAPRLSLRDHPRAPRAAPLRDRLRARGERMDAAQTPLLTPGEDLLAREPPRQMPDDLGRALLLLVEAPPHEV